MEFHDKFVDFHKYCQICAYRGVEEDKDPCDHCLESPVNTDSHKPVKFKLNVTKENKKNG